MGTQSAKFNTASPPASDEFCDWFSFWQELYGMNSSQVKSDEMHHVTHHVKVWYRKNDEMILKT